MKITLDLADLVARGELSQPEAERLKRLAAKDSGSLAFGFGIWTLNQRWRGRATPPASTAAV